MFRLRARFHFPAFQHARKFKGNERSHAMSVQSKRLVEKWSKRGSNNFNQFWKLSESRLAQTMLASGKLNRTYFDVPRQRIRPARKRRSASARVWETEESHPGVRIRFRAHNPWRCYLHAVVS